MYVSGNYSNAFSNSEKKKMILASMMVSSNPKLQTSSSQVEDNASSLWSVPIVNLPQENETVPPQTIDLGPSKGDSKTLRGRPRKCNSTSAQKDNEIIDISSPTCKLDVRFLLLFIYFTYLETTNALSNYSFVVG